MPAARNCRGVVVHKGAVVPDQGGEAARLRDRQLHSRAAARSTSLRWPLPNASLAADCLQRPLLRHMIGAMLLLRCPNNAWLPNGLPCIKNVIKVIFA